MLLAVERIGADVAALGRALGDQPEEVAARLDIDAATAAIGVRVGALGSALDQLRLSLLAALDRTTDRLDAPPWLPDVRAALADLASRADQPRWLPDLGVAVTQVGPAVDPPGQVAISRASLADLTLRVDAPAWLADLRATLADRTPAAESVTELADLRAALTAVAHRIDTPPWLAELHTALVDRISTLDVRTELAELAAALTGVARDVYAPAWLPDLRAALTERTAAAPAWPTGPQTALADNAGRGDSPAWLVELRGTLADIGRRLDSPAWLPELRDAVADLASRLDGLTLAAGQGELRNAIAGIGPVVERALGAGRGPEPVLQAIAALGDDQRLDELTTTVDRMADDQRLDELTTTVARIADDPRLDDVVAAVAAADPGERLGRVEKAVADLADGVRAGAAIADALDHLGERLASIEGAAGRVAEDARLLIDRVSPVPDRLSAIASQVDRITPLARVGDQAGSFFDQLDHVGAGVDELIRLLQAETDPAGRSRPHENGEQGADEVDERFEAVVDVLSGVTRRQDEVLEAVASVLSQMRGPKGIDAVMERMEQRERSVAARLDRIDAELRRHGVGGPAPAAPGVPDAGLGRGIEALVAALDGQERALGSRLDQIDAELRRLGEETAAAAPQTVATVLGTVLDRLQQQETEVASHLDWVGERLSEVAAHLVPDGSAGAADTREARTGKRLDAVADVLARVARRQDDLGAAMAKLLDGDRDPVRGERLGAPARRQGELAASSVEAFSAVTQDLAGLVERLDRRLAGVESALEQDGSPHAPPPARSSSAEVASLRLAELRVERARVQARLREERLLAAEDWDAEP